MNKSAKPQHLAVLPIESLRSIAQDYSIVYNIFFTIELGEILQSHDAICKRRPMNIGRDM